MGISEIIEGMQVGNIKAAVVMADGVNLSARQLSALVETLASVETLIVSSVFDNDITAKADIVFPAAPFSEQQSTVTNLVSRVQLVRKASESRFDELAGWQVFCGLAKALGKEGFEYDSASEIFEAICETIPDYQNLSYDTLENGGAITLTRPHGDDTRSDFEITKPDFSQFTSDGFYFAPGRVLHQPDRETTLGERQYLNVIDRVEWIELHPDDFETLGIAEGDTVAVKDTQGNIVAQWRSDGFRPRAPRHHPNDDAVRRAGDIHGRVRVS